MRYVCTFYLIVACTIVYSSSFSKHFGLLELCHRFDLLSKVSVSVSVLCRAIHCTLSFRNFLLKLWQRVFIGFLLIYLLIFIYILLKGKQIIKTRHEKKKIVSLKDLLYLIIQFIFSNLNSDYLR